MKEAKGAKEGNRVKVTKVAKVTNGKESANKGKGDEVLRSGNVVEKPKENIHPWQRRTIGGSFSGHVLLEYGGEELGEKSGRVAWKDPDNIKQEEQTTEARESGEMVQPTKKVGVKSKPPTKFVTEPNRNEEADGRDEENRFGVGASTVVNTMELPNFQIDQATSLLQEKCRSIERGDEEEVGEMMEEETDESTPNLVIDSRSEGDDVMEVSVTVREDNVKEESPDVVGEEINILKVVEAAKKGICERKERIKRFLAEKETSGVYLAELKREEAEDIKQLEEIDRVKMKLEREQLEIRRKVRERDIKIMNTKQLFKEKEEEEARHKEKLKEELRAMKELVETESL